MHVSSSESIQARREWREILKVLQEKKKTTQFRTLRPETQVALMVNTCLPAQEKLIDVGLIPGLVSFPGGGHGNPLQYSCLENPKDRGA